MKKPYPGNLVVTFFLAGFANLLEVSLAHYVFNSIVKQCPLLNGFGYLFQIPVYAARLNAPKTTCIT